MRWLTAGESHGPALSAIIEGIPASVQITTADIDYHLARRRLGVGRGARQNFEADKVTILGGIRLGLTQGGPISIQVANSEWPKWEKVMSADPVPEEEIKDLGRNAPLSRPRPGHADLVGMQKYDFDDARAILERASARETAARVALGEVAKKFLQQAAGITVMSHVVSIGTVATDSDVIPNFSDLEKIDQDPVRCFSATASAAMQAEITAAQSDGDPASRGACRSDGNGRCGTGLQREGVLRVPSLYARQSRDPAGQGDQAGRVRARHGREGRTHLCLRRHPAV